MVASQISNVVLATALLDYTPEVARATASIFERVRRVIPEIEWPVHAPYIAAINELKRERNAIILAHNYQTPEIFHGVADLPEVVRIQDGHVTLADHVREPYGPVGNNRWLLKKVINGNPEPADSS